ncbi:hypothetical protein K1X12_12010 [Hyphomonas sp. WL0036]|uniref:hypothetical protein n=1 Tax=Hyphomonas sediminis TaxID=2866160 RepID=UPI001C7FDB00|nr:hypothetical protein [Hyphomonas sediminis]MBY9067627.1 hypothetical protein [Hyphomonas sediminis]
MKWPLVHPARFKAVLQWKKWKDNKMFSESPLTNIRTAVVVGLFLLAPIALADEEVAQSDFSFIEGKWLYCQDRAEPNLFHEFYFGEGQGWEIWSLFGSRAMIPIELASLSEQTMRIEYQYRVSPNMQTRIGINIDRRNLQFAAIRSEQLYDEDFKTVVTLSGECLIQDTFKTLEEFERMLDKKVF